eukprot:scaffold143_cov260-Pinguiococcus_pyrenoidosus.AAC.29
MLQAKLCSTQKRFMKLALNTPSPLSYALLSLDATLSAGLRHSGPPLRSLPLLWPNGGRSQCAGESGSAASAGGHARGQNLRSSPLRNDVFADRGNEQRGAPAFLRPPDDCFGLAKGGGKESLALQYGENRFRGLRTKRSASGFDVLRVSVE